MIRALIFDFNGVLVDDEHLHFELFREVLSREGVELSAERYHDQYLGLDDRGCFEAALRDAGQEAGRGRVDELIARKAGRYVESAESGLRYFPDAAGRLAELAGRWPLAICSGALRPEIELALGRLGRRDQVMAIVSAEDTTRCKPDPQGYQLALAALRTQGDVYLGDLRPDECLVIEDSLAGVASAKEAGMWAVGIAQTYEPAELRSAGADAVLTVLEDLSPVWIERTFFALRGAGGDGNGDG